MSGKDLQGTGVLNSLDSCRLRFSAHRSHERTRDGRAWLNACASLEAAADVLYAAHCLAKTSTSNFYYWNVDVVS
jgi:hypothetical protein